MITKQTVSRELICLFLFIAVLWTHWSIIIAFKGKIDKDDCNFNPNEYFMAVVILEAIGNIFLSIAFMTHGHLLVFFDDSNQSIINEKLSTSQFFQSFSITLFLVCSIMTNITFFKSKYTDGYLETCKTTNAEFEFRLITFSFAWILFFIYAYMICGILFTFFITIWIALKESNLFRCTRITRCFARLSSWRKVRPITVRPNEKITQTECEASIPIKSLKNEMKPFTCMICMSNMIDIIIKPCYHICMCNECYAKLPKKNCPCCSKNIKKIKNIYIANIDDYECDEEKSQQIDNPV